MTVMLLWPLSRQASRAARLGSGGASYVRNGLFRLFWGVSFSQITPGGSCWGSASRGSSREGQTKAFKLMRPRSALRKVKISS